MFVGLYSYKMVLSHWVVAHLWANGTKFGRFHAKEYPSYEKESFPYNMGYCQIGKTLLDWVSLVWAWKNCSEKELQSL